MMPMQAVPTGLAVGPDGALYVGELTGFPFPAGQANVYRVPAEGGDPEVYASGFTNVVDIAFGPDGTLYVLEYQHHGMMSGDLTGGLWAVPAGGGEPELIATDPLVQPGGILVAEDGTIYISNNAMGKDSTGEILAIAR